MWKLKPNHTRLLKEVPHPFIHHHDCFGYSCSVILSQSLLSNVCGIIYSGQFKPTRGEGISHLLKMYHKCISFSTLFLQIQYVRGRQVKAIEFCFTVWQISKKKIIGGAVNCLYNCIGQLSQDQINQDDGLVFGQSICQQAYVVNSVYCHCLMHLLNCQGIP